MCKPEHRVAADRRGFRYPSDLSDAEWTPITPLIPPAKRGGRKRTVEVREILNAIFYVLATGCQWSRAVSPRGLCQRSLGQAATQPEPALPPALNVRAGTRPAVPKERGGSPREVAAGSLRGSWLFRFRFEDFSVDDEFAEAAVMQRSRVFASGIGPRFDDLDHKEIEFVDETRVDDFAFKIGVAFGYQGAA